MLEGDILINQLKAETEKKAIIAAITEALNQRDRVIKSLKLQLAIGQEYDAEEWCEFSEN